MNIKICNLRYESCKYPYDVRVDRASILGNPFRMENEGRRDEVCDKYEAYFNKSFNENTRFRNAVMDLVKTYRKYGQLRLFCWCAPKRCHADYIKRVAERIADQ